MRGSLALQTPQEQSKGEKSAPNQTSRAQAHLEDRSRAGRGQGEGRRTRSAHLRGPVPGARLKPAHELKPCTRAQALHTSRRGGHPRPPTPTSPARHTRKPTGTLRAPVTARSPPSQRRAPLRSSRTSSFRAKSGSRDLRKPGKRRKEHGAMT